MTAWRTGMPHARRRSAHPREQSIQAAILDFLAAHPARVIAWRCNSGMARSLHGEGIVRLAPKGTPDIVGVIFGPDGVGRFLGVEVKRPGEHPTDVQLAFGAAVKRLGGVWFVARSVEDVQLAIRAAGLTLSPPARRLAR